MGDITKYQIGAVIHHKLFDYRGVIVDVDPEFQNTEAWYLLMTRSKPDKQQPWYHVLVDNTDYVTYVAEQNLELDTLSQPIHHPKLNKYFKTLKNGCYLPKSKLN